MSTVMELASAALERYLSNISAATAAIKSIITPVYNVTGYGVPYDGLSNAIPALQALIDTITDGEVYFPKGTYLFAKAGTRLLTYSSAQKGYGLLLLNKSNIKFTFAKGAKIVMPIGDASTFNAIWVEGCDDIEFVRPEFEGTGITTTLILEEGAGICVTESTRIRVREPKSVNCRGNTRAYFSEHVNVVDGFSQIYANMHADAHFSLSRCKESNIDDCTSYGVTKNGDIFIYGADSINSNIRRCKSYAYVYGDDTKAIPHTDGHGILIDGSGRNCKIIDCYAYGHYTGIDIKSATEGGTIQGCTAEKCFLGIGARKGESPSPVNVINIIGNTIIPNGGNGNTTPYLGTITEPFAISVFDCYGGANISDNIMYNTMDNQANNDFYGIVIGMSDDVGDNIQGGFTIANNQFCFESRNGTKWSTNRKMAIYVVSSYKVITVNINGNTFDLPSTGILTNVIQADRVWGLNVSGNNFSSITAAGLPIFKLNTCRRANIIGNTFGMHYGLVDAVSCQGFNFSGNVCGDSLAGIASSAILLDACAYCGINGNTVNIISGAGLDGTWIKGQNGDNWLTITGNTLQLANKGPADFYDVTAVNKTIADNTVD